MDVPGAKATDPWVSRWICIGARLLHARMCRSPKCTLSTCASNREFFKHVTECEGCDVSCRTTRDVMRHLESCIMVTCKVCSEIRPPYPDMNRPDTDKLEFKERRSRVQNLAMLYIHAFLCVAAPGECVVHECAMAKQRIEHMHMCRDLKCRFDWCVTGIFIRKHVYTCDSLSCLLCTERIRRMQLNIPYNSGLTLKRLRANTKALFRRFFGARRLNINDLINYGFSIQMSFETKDKGDIAASYVETSLYDLTPTIEWYLRTLALMWLTNYAIILKQPVVTNVSLENSVILHRALSKTVGAEPIDAQGITETFWSIQRRSMKGPKTPLSPNVSELHVNLWRRIGELDCHMDLQQCEDDA